MLEQRLKYRGNLVEELEDRVMGPDTAGGYLRVVEASYDFESDTTYARVEPVNPAHTGFVLDHHGQARYVPVGGGE